MLFDWKKRCRELEILDLGSAHYSQEEFIDAHDKLGRIGSFLGGDRLNLAAFRDVGFTAGSILDVGCGGGHFSAILANTYPEAKVLGVDTSKDAIDYAKARYGSVSNLGFEHLSDAEPDVAPNSYDIIVSTFVCHHMKDAEIVSFLRAAVRGAKKAVIINDLHRHPLAWIGFAVVSSLFFRNRLIQHDGLLSVRRSFVRSDWQNYLKQAGIPQEVCTIRWGIPFRWIVTISKD